MRAILFLVFLVLLAGCTLTPTQKKWAGIAAGVLVVGAIAAHDDSDKPPMATTGIGNPAPCTPQPDGSCR